MARIQLLLGLFALHAWQTTADNASIRWVELDGHRNTIVNLSHGPGTFYIMNIKGMSNLAIENGVTRVMNEDDYNIVRTQFGDVRGTTRFMGLGSKRGRSGRPRDSLLDDKHVAHDRWYRKALRRYKSQRSRMEQHMHDELW